VRPPGFGTPPPGDYGLSSNRGLTGLLTYPGLDAVTLSFIPGNTPVVGCYVTGFVNCGTAEAWFPRARIVSIATNDGAEARCLDIESGDAVPSQAVAWTRWMLRVGVYRPCLYSPAFEMRTVAFDLSVSGLKRSQYTLWVADWDGNPTIPVGFDAKQWASNCCVDHDTFGSWFFSSVTPPRPRPKPPADLHHYLWFPTKPKVAGNKNERLTVLEYDGARLRPTKYAIYLKTALEPELAADANRVSYLAHHVWNHGKRKPNWTPNHGGWRYQQLIHRAQGKRLVK
jgi:hypothetical protein